MVGEGVNGVRWVLVGAAVLLFGIILIIITKVSITMEIYHSAHKNHYKVRIAAWFGMISIPIEGPNHSKESALVSKAENFVREKTEYSLDEPGIPLHEKVIEKMSSLYDWAETMLGASRIARLFLRKVYIKKWQWHTMIGTGDAASTGVFAGAAWAFKSGIALLASRYTLMKAAPAHMISPSFQRACMETHFIGMIQFRLGHAILAGIRLLAYLRKNQKKLENRPISLSTENGSDNSSL